jgi:hypothetical protein
VDNFHLCHETPVSARLSTIRQQSRGLSLLILWKGVYRLSPMFFTGYRRCLKHLSTAPPKLPAIADVFTGYRRCCLPAIADAVYRLSPMLVGLNPSAGAGLPILNTRARLNHSFLTF